MDGRPVVTIAVELLLVEVGETDITGGAPGVEVLVPVRTTGTAMAKAGMGETSDFHPHHIVNVVRNAVPQSRGPEQGNNPGNNLHVSGLSSKVDNKDLELLFGKFGKVSSLTTNTR